MLRDINDLGITLYEDIPKHQFENIEQWYAISRSTGDSVASIIKDMTGFVKYDKMYPKGLE